MSVAYTVLLNPLGISSCWVFLSCFFVCSFVSSIFVNLLFLFLLLCSLFWFFVVVGVCV